MAETKRQLAARRGYLAISIRERGAVGRGLKAAYNAASESSWTEASEYFHENFRDDRFTDAHAFLAGYAARKGQNMPPGSKAFERSYYGRKLNSKHGGGRGQANPLVWSGETRRRVATEFRVSATSKGGKVSYGGARTLNFRHPKSRIRMNQEFRRLIPIERQRLARIYDVSLDKHLNTD